MSQLKTKSKKRLYAFIIGILVIFGSPIVFSIALFMIHPQWMNHTKNGGSYVKPPITFSKLNLTGTRGQSIDTKQWSKKWLMFYVMPLPCRKTCYINLIKLAKLQESFSPKVQSNLAIIVATFVGQGGNHVLRQYGDFTHVYLQRHNFIHTFVRSASKRRAMLQGMLYIVNSDGYVVVSYHTDATETNIKGDLSKFLASTN